MTATLKSIAEECGVSLQTVSRVLNPNFSHRHSKETRDLVLKKVEELGYRPNAAAQAMKSGSFRSVLMLQSNDPVLSYVTGETLYSIQKTLGTLDYKLICTLLPEDKEEAEAELKKILRTSFVDGILVSISRKIPKWLEALLGTMSVPVFWIGSKHPNCSICHDDFLATYQITKRFIKLGHKEIAYADFFAFPENKKTWHFSTMDRMNGYLKAMKEEGYETRIIQPESKRSPDSMVAFSKENLLTNPPTAILTYGIGTARAIMYSLYRNGFSIPDDVSLVTFHIFPAIENDLNIATYIPSKQSVGKIAAEMIYDQIQNKSFITDPIVIPFDFFEGDTISQPRR